MHVMSHVLRNLCCRHARGHSTPRADDVTSRLIKPHHVTSTLRRPALWSPRIRPPRARLASPAAGASDSDSGNVRSVSAQPTTKAAALAHARPPPYHGPATGFRRHRGRRSAVHLCGHRLSHRGGASSSQVPEKAAWTSPRTTSKSAFSSLYK